MITKSSILVVDDDQEMLDTICELLEVEGYDVTSAADGQEMLEIMNENKFDLVLLDLIMPGEDGLSLARKIKENLDIPIIMVTGQANPIDKVIGLEIGAEDYVTKPFHSRELIVRVKNLLRRASTSYASTSNLEEKVAVFEGWELDFMASTLRSPEGIDIPLTAYEFRVLSEFVQRPNRVLTREQIMDYVYGHERSSIDRSVDVIVGKVRKKINDNPKNPQIILTLRGQGYKFVADVRYR